VTPGTRGEPALEPSGLSRLQPLVIAGAWWARHRVGPPPLPGEGRADRTERRLAMFLALLGIAVFAAAALLDPYQADGSPRTHGTHQQLGLPPCWTQAILGLPCPTCGMTTSISLLVHGDPGAAMAANWAGVVFGAAGLVATPLLVWIAVSGRRPGSFRLERVVGILFWVGLTAALVRFGLVAAGGLLRLVG
jgi:hypothetical protein